MKIAICEDNTKEARQLEEALTRYLEANSLSAEIDIFVNAEDFLSEFEPGKYQIIFMDIYLKKDGKTGMDAAIKVREADKNAALIFVTQTEDYLRAGYSVAVFYIVKPIKQEDMNAAMEKCQIQIENFAKTIEIIVNRQLLKIKLRDIYFIESIKKACVFVFAAGQVTAVNMSMDTLLDDKFEGVPFVRCHRSYIVNLLYVKDISKNDFILENGNRVPIGRTYQAAMRKAYKEYFLMLIQGKI